MTFCAIPKFSQNDIPKHHRSALCRDPFRHRPGVGDRRLRPFPPGASKTRSGQDLRVDLRHFRHFLSGRRRRCLQSDVEEV